MFPSKLFFNKIPPTLDMSLRSVMLFNIGYDFAVSSESFWGTVDLYVSKFGNANNFATLKWSLKLNRTLILLKDTFAIIALLSSARGCCLPLAGFSLSFS